MPKSNEIPTPMDELDKMRAFDELQDSAYDREMKARGAMAVAGLVDYDGDVMSRKARVDAQIIARMQMGEVLDPSEVAELLREDPSIVSKENS